MFQKQNEMFKEQKGMFQKHTEILLKYYNEIYENASTPVNQKQNMSTSNYDDICRKISLYENKISFLNAELDLLKKENTHLHEKHNLSGNKEISSIKEGTKELRKVMSFIKGEVRDLRETLTRQPR